MLHITNGESAAQKLRQTPLSGSVISWDDVLHEGPTPAGLALDEMREVRIRFIEGRGWASADTVRENFVRRDQMLLTYDQHEEVTLWFEHDLYDQLQLIQLLDWFSRQNLGGTRLSLICINAFPGKDNFHGLGELSAPQLYSLWDTRHEVSAAELALGHEAWTHFCASNPMGLEMLLQQDTGALPFLKDAVFRHLEQFPSVKNGLGRTQMQLVEAVVAGSQTPVEIFLVQQRNEASPFMGDTIVWTYLSELCGGREPLIHVANGKEFVLPWQIRDEDTFHAQRLAMTTQGQAVMGGQADWVRSNGIERWLGGVHLQGQDAAWRWDADGRKLVRSMVE